MDPHILGDGPAGNALGPRGKPRCLRDLGGHRVSKQRENASTRRPGRRFATRQAGPSLAMPVPFPGTLRAPGRCQLGARALLRPVLHRTRGFCSSICPQHIRELLEILPPSACAWPRASCRGGGQHTSCFSWFYSPFQAVRAAGTPAVSCTGLCDSSAASLSPAEWKISTQKDDLLLFLRQQKLLADPKVRRIPQPNAIPARGSSCCQLLTGAVEKRGTE